MPTARKSARTKRVAGKSASRARKTPKTAKFFEISTCATCRKARAYMKRRGFRLDVRDLQKHRLSAAELEKLIGRRDHEDFLNPRSKTFREQDMDDNPPTRREAVSWMSKDPGLIRRPVVVAGGRVVVGFDKNGMARL